jgi:hypothetical protein
MSFGKILILLIVTGVFTIIFITVPIHQVTKEISSTKEELKQLKTGLESLNKRLNKSSLLKI